METLKSNNRLRFVLLVAVLGLCSCIAVPVMEGFLAAGRREATKEAAPAGRSAEISALETQVAATATALASGPTVTPRPTATPTPHPTATRKPTSTHGPIGLSRTSPAPLGEVIVADNLIALGILEVLWNAWPRVEAYNMFNPPPEEGNQYILVRIWFRNASKGKDDTARVSPFDFRVVGERGIIYERAYAVLDLDELESTELFGGAQDDGWLLFEVGRGERDLILIYDSGWDTKARWLSLQ